MPVEQKVEGLEELKRLHNIEVAHVILGTKMSAKDRDRSCVLLTNILNLKFCTYINQHYSHPVSVANKYYGDTNIASVVGQYDNKLYNTLITV